MRSHIISKKRAAGLEEEIVRTVLLTRYVPLWINIAAISGIVASKSELFSDIHNRHSQPIQH